MLQRVPNGFEFTVTDAYRKITSMEGVLGFSSPHFWEHSPSLIVGSIRIQVKEGANEQKIRVQVWNIFRELGVRNMTIQIEKDVIPGKVNCKTTLTLFFKIAIYEF